MNKDERFESLLADCSVRKHERPKTEVEELSEIEIKTALEMYRAIILSERK